MANLDLTWAVRSVDSLLRSRQGIEEITDDGECLLRISLARATRAVLLSDGTRVAVDDAVLQLHLWNEHLPVMSEEGPNTAWANQLKRRMRYSFGIVADRLEHDTRLGSVRAVHGAPAFPQRLGPLQLGRVAEHFGFDVIETANGKSTAGHLYTLCDSLLLWALIWAFNPVGLRGKGLLHGRCEIWMSRGRLIERYARRGGDVFFPTDQCLQKR